LIPDLTRHPAINFGTPANSGDNRSARGNRCHCRHGTDKHRFVAELLQLSNHEATSPHSVLR
jgi:hypothetical protein